MHLLEQIGLRLLEKSREYYDPPQDGDGTEWALLDEEKYSEMLCEIDAFSEQFQQDSSHPGEKIPRP